MSIIYNKKKIGWNFRKSRVAESATIGSGCYIGDYAVIGDNCTIGDNTIIYDRVSLVRNCSVGNDCVIQPGVTMGADGFALKDWRKENF